MKFFSAFFGDDIGPLIGNVNDVTVDRSNDVVVDWPMTWLLTGR